MKPNEKTIELLQKVKEKILGEPTQFDMDHFFTKHQRSGGELIPNCGTAACIAGWTLAIDKGLNPEEASGAVGRYIDYSYEAQTVLGISSIQARTLFYVNQWPVDFYNDWHDIDYKDYKDKAEVAARRIDHFCKTGY